MHISQTHSWRHLLRLMPGLVAALFLTAARVNAQILYVTDLSNNSISAVDSGGNVSTLASGLPYLAQPLGLAMDALGNFYVANSGPSSLAMHDSIGKFNAMGQSPQLIAIDGALSAVYGLTFDAQGNLLVANQGNSTIQKYSTSGAYLGTFISIGGGQPFGLAFGPNGHLYATLNGGNIVAEYTASGSFVQDIGINGGLDGPAGLAFDALGDLYVANRNNNTIAEFSLAVPNGQLLNTFGSSVLQTPEGLIFNAQGNLLVANVGGTTIREFSPSGTDLGNFATGLDGPAFMVFGPAPAGPPGVPEPATLVLAGAGLVGLLGYRRWRRAG